MTCNKFLIKIKKTGMKHLTLFALLSCILIVSTSISKAQSRDKQVKIEEAMSAAPPSISANATILDYSAEPGGKKIVLRQGTNEWTCLPDNPHMPGNNPMCVDSQMIELFSAISENREPNITQTGFGYFLQGGAPRSNANPFDTSPSPENEWMEVQAPHIVVVSPDKSILEGLSTNSENGGPWVMWSGTPYVHIMIPVPKYIKE